MVINERTTILFRVVVHPNLVVVHTRNTETNKTCHHYISNNNDDSHAIAYIFGGIDCKDKLFVGYGCHDWDAIIVNYIISHYRMGMYPADIYAHMQQEIDEEEQKGISKYFYSIDIKTILFPEKQRLSLWQLAYKLNQNTSEYIPYSNPVPDNKITDVISDDTEIDIIENALEVAKDKIALRFNLLNEYKVNAMNVDDTLLGIRFMTRKYLDKTGESFDGFISKRTSPHKFKVSDFVKMKQIPKNDKLKNFVKETMNLIVNPVDIDKKTWQQELLLPRLKLSINSSGVRSTNTPERFICKENEVIIHYDFTSMFPTVMCNYSLFSRHLSHDFHELYNLFRTERIKAKMAGNKDRSDFLKMVINAAIGLMNSDWSYMYDPVMFISIKIQSMFIMIRLIDLLLPKVRRIIQVNIDGIFVLVDKSQESSIDEEIKSFMQEEDMFFTKTDYCKMFQSSVNDYLCQRENGDVVAKGLFSINENSKTLKPAIVIEAIQRNLLFGDDIRDVIRGCNNPKKFLLSMNVANRFLVKNGDKMCRSAVRFYYSTGMSHVLTRHSDGKQTIIDPNGVTVVDDVSKIDKSKINYTPYLGMANKVVMQFKQLLLFTLIKKHKTK